MTCAKTSLNDWFFRNWAHASLEILNILIFTSSGHLEIFQGHTPRHTLAVAKTDPPLRKWQASAGATASIWRANSNGRHLEPSGLTEISWWETGEPGMGTWRCGQCRKKTHTHTNTHNITQLYVYMCRFCAWIHWQSLTYDSYDVIIGWFEERTRRYQAFHPYSPWIWGRCSSSSGPNDRSRPSPDGKKGACPVEASRNP